MLHIVLRLRNVGPCVSDVTAYRPIASSYCGVFRWKWHNMTHGATRARYRRRCERTVTRSPLNGPYRQFRVDSVVFHRVLWVVIYSETSLWLAMFKFRDVSGTPMIYYRYVPDISSVATWPIRSWCMLFINIDITDVSCVCPGKICRLIMAYTTGCRVVILLDLRRKTKSVVSYKSICICYFVVTADRSDQ